MAKSTLAQAKVSHFLSTMNEQEWHLKQKEKRLNAFMEQEQSLKSKMACALNDAAKYDSIAQFKGWQDSVSRLQKDVHEQKEAISATARPAPALRSTGNQRTDMLKAKRTQALDKISQRRAFMERSSMRRSDSLERMAVGRSACLGTADADMPMN